MKKITLILGCVLSFAALTVVAQKKEITPVQPVRCGTDEAIAKTFREHPELKIQFDARNAASFNRGNQTSRVSTLTGPVTIPVIVHVVLPNPDLITEEAIDFFIAQLNRDFSGFNPDSTNGAPFYSVRGHSLIRFTRARRTPAGLITNGIEKRVGTTTISGNTYQPIKHASTATGGLDPWDVTQYYNLWVGDGGAAGLLGIAPTIGVGAATETTTSAVGIDGVCVDYRGFSNGCGITYAEYNLARTAVHEIGHNFGLFHIFSGCTTGADFAQVLPAGQTLPANLFGPAADDTPNQSAATTNCPTGTVASNCAGVPNPPGKMYQNFMDYTFDACYSMFTKQQVGRMEYMLETYRAGYLTTQGAIPPTSFPTIDAGLTNIVSPGGTDFATACPNTAYALPTCPGSYVPRVTVRNYGSATITSIVATVTVGAVTSAPQTFNISLNTNGVITLVFPAQNFGTGTSPLTFTIISVNGVADTYTANNTITKAVTITSGSILPFSQDFVTTVFPPPNMTIFNPNNNITWVRNANGNGTAGSAFFDNYTNGVTGQTDDIRTLPLATFTPVAGDSVIVTFDMAHRPFSLTNATYADTFRILVSNDCGQTFTTLKSYYNTSVPSIATGAVSTGAYTVPVAADWRKERIAIGGAVLNGSPIVVAFRNICKFGNNTFVDNINISRKVDRDLVLTSIVNPGATVCSGSFTPQVRVTNNGIQTVSSFRVGYRIGTGTIINQTFTQTIAPAASVTVNLAAVTGLASGNFNITAFTADLIAVGGAGDQVTANDTLTKAFTVLNLLTSPLVEGFEGTFPPNGWSIRNGGTANTWVKAPVGNNSSASAFIDNYNFNNVGEVDALQSPAIKLLGSDSVVISFDLAHKNYTGANDALAVKVSTDCGNTFTTVFNRAGAALATAGASTANYTNPAASDWKTQRISLSGATYATGSLIVQFECTNDYGNNIFLDNINIKGLYKRDIELTSINSLVLCPPTPTPTVTVTNVGVDTIRAFKVSYTIDGGAASQTTLTGLALPSNQSMIVSLNPIATLAPGVHTIKAYTFEPITSAGTGDPNPGNDTLTRTVTMVTSVAAPLAEGFETTVFPPTGWARTNPDGGITWDTSRLAARTGNKSAYVNNYNYSTNGAKDDLYTPVVTYSGVDSVSLSFDVAATTYSYPGSTAVPMDTLEVLLTTDCGATFTSIYKKWGAELQTIGDPNHSQTEEFIPSGSNLWRNEKIDLTAWASRSPIQLAFRNTSNFENNIYVDNVNVNTKTLLAKLKAQGFLIYPTPFTSTFTIQHYLAPKDLRSMGVYNSVGQMVMTQNFGNNGTTSMINVDMSRFANGMYTVVLYYATKTVTQKVIKGR